MKTRNILAAVIAVMLMSTCTKKVGTKEVYFNEKILPIFVSNCSMSGCHDSKSKEEGLDLSNYEGIMKGIVAKHPLQSEIYSSIQGKNPEMPPKPYSKLNNNEVGLIKLWINMGAPNSSREGICDTSLVTYSASIKPF